MYHPPTVLLDLDDVLADCVGGIVRLYGTTRAELELRWPIGHWQIAEPLGTTQADLFDRIDAAGEAFWLGLQPLPWARDLVKLVQSITDDWYIVSSPVASLHAYSWKAKWLKRFFGRRFDRFVLTQHKHLLARRGTLLIDDCDANVRQFIVDGLGKPTGGKALVFPAYNNGLHVYRHDPMAYITSCLKELYCASNIS